MSLSTDIDALLAEHLSEDSALAQSDAAAAQALRDQITQLQAQVVELEAELAAAQPPPPPPAKVLYGGNFGSGPDESKYVKPVAVARLFPGNGYPADLTTSAAYREAKAAGAKVVILDFSAGWTAAGVTATVSSAVRDGVTVYASCTHEPEHGDKMAPAEWVRQNVGIAPVIRTAGGKVAPILQAATVAGVKGRVLSAYSLPKGVADAAGFDLYPDTQIIAQDKLLPMIEAAAKSVFGCDSIVFGEYASKDPAQIAAFKAWAPGAGVIAVAYWSQGEYVLTAATAAAWSK